MARMARWKPDRGLEVRMFVTMLILAALYLAFLAYLAYRGTSALVMVIFVGGMMFIQYFFSDQMVLWSTGAREVSESEAPELHEMINRLCAIADIPKPKVAIVNTGAPNAFATGRSQSNAVVAVTAGILRQLDRSELEAVLAHELSHVKNRDAMVMTVASFFSTVAFFLVRYLLFFGGGDRRDRGGGGIIVVWLVSLAVWITSFILIRALSRYREFAADRGSAVITGRPSDLASALMKISGGMSRAPTQDLRKVEGARALYIMPALAGQELFNLLSTHPSTEARIMALERIEKEMEATGV